MRFLYKIYSGYDGFTPAKIDSRRQDGKLTLRWKRYLDVVDRNSECWIFFHGPHRFQDGVYVKGFVESIDRDSKCVTLRVNKYSVLEPLVSRKENDRIAAELKSIRYRQVFLWPANWPIVNQCDTSTCAARQCGGCGSFANFPLIEQGHARRPKRLRRGNARTSPMVSAHWIIPSRCYCRNNRRQSVEELTERFYSFKLGEKSYAFPFALAITRQLQRENLSGFDCVVPIPLSPNKEASGESHRTFCLAREIGRLLKIPARKYLSLSRSVSKRSMRSQGYSEAEFKDAYYDALVVEIPTGINHVLLVDDVATHGTTLAQSLRRIDEHDTSIKVTMATAGQMIVKSVVVSTDGFLASGSRRSR